MLPGYRLDFTRDAADQMAYEDLANDGDGVHLLTIGLVPFAVTLVDSHSVVTIRLTTTLRSYFFGGFCRWQDLRAALQRSQTQVWRRVSN